MIGLPTVNGPATATGLPAAIVPTVTAAQLNVQYPLLTQIGRVAPISIYNPFKLRVRLSAANTTLFTNLTVQTIPFDTIDFDTSNSFNATTHQFKVPISGYYNMVGKINFTIPGGGSSGIKWALMLARFYQNGNLVTQGVQTVSGDFTSTTGFITGAGYDSITSDTAFFAKNDLVDLRGSQTNDAAITLGVAAGYFTYADIHLLST